MVVSGIYIIINTIDSKCYIGKSVDINKRWSRHKSGHGSNIRLTRAFKQHGLDNFTFSILELVEKDFISAAELWWISYFISLGYSIGDTLYNFTLGGEGCLGKKVTVETRAKLSVSAKLRCTDSVYRAELSSRVLGNKNPMYGKTLSDEVRAKISASQTGEKNHNFGKVGKDNPVTGLVRSPEVREKIAAAKRGDKNPNFGRTLTKEQIEHRTSVYKANKTKKKETQNG